MTTIEEITVEDEESDSRVDYIPDAVDTPPNIVADVVADTLGHETTIAPVEFVTSVRRTDWTSRIAKGLRVDPIASEIRGLVVKG